jgi:hypothetical protein
MSRVEDLSRQYVLPFLDKHYKKYGEHKKMELSMFDGYDMMSAYEEGYHQAEKDLELTWEDMRELHIIFAEIDVDIELCKTNIKTETLGYYQEVLKRFKDLKNGTTSK